MQRHPDAGGEAHLDPIRMDPACAALARPFPRSAIWIKLGTADRLTKGAEMTLRISSVRQYPGEGRRDAIGSGPIGDGAAPPGGGAMRVALWQGRSPSADASADASDDPTATLETALLQAEAALAAAGALGASVLVLPELWLQGYNAANVGAVALSADAPALDRLAHAARQHGSALVLGFAEKDGDRLYNTALCIGAEGTVRARYRKLQLYGLREKALFTAGGGYVTFAIGQDRQAALLICYDIEFAPHVARLAALGAEVIFVPTANMMPFTHVPRHTVPAMAANHGVAIAYANYCGQDGDLTYTGESVIVGPHGEVLARAGQTPALLIVDLPDRDPSRLSTQAADLRTV